MAGIRSLSTLANRPAAPIGSLLKKPAPLAKLDRAVEKKKATDQDARDLAKWSASVLTRDQYVDRFTGKPVKKASEVGVTHPDAAHAHHVVPRADAAVRTDRRNGLCVSWATHQLLEAHELTVIGTKFFRKSGRRFINCDAPVRFKETS